MTPASPLPSLSPHSSGRGEEITLASGDPEVLFPPTVSLGMPLAKRSLPGRNEMKPKARHRGGWV